jgi:hypothetical protein
MQAKITIIMAAAGMAAVLALGVADAKAEAEAPVRVPDFDYTVGPVPKNGDTPPKAAPSPDTSPRDTSVRRALRRPAPKQIVAQKRAPTRIIVRPMLRNRHDATEFPRADNLGFPGRNAVRQCTSWLATEYRPSGTVVTPQMRCWWEGG